MRERKNLPLATGQFWRGARRTFGGEKSDCVTAQAREVFMAHEAQQEIEIHDLRSSWLSRAVYDPRSQELTVYTAHGRSYTLNGVPPDMVESFVEDDSPGTYFNNNLKGKY